MTKPIIIIAHVSYIDCPHCGKSKTGFVSDPRGATVDCEDCNQPFVVPVDAPVEMS